MEKEYAEYLLKKTQEDYNLIAEDFSRTRVVVPEDIKIPTEYSKPGEKVLDLGCGNGSLFSVLKEKKVNYCGVDNSEELIKIAKEKYPEGDFQRADAFKLPFPDNYFDKIYCIGVLHHIPSRGLHVQFLKEAQRVLKPEGMIILRVWDFWKSRKRLILIIKYAFSKIFGESKLDFGDIFYPWKDSQGKIMAQRYFHCFTKREINKLFINANFKIEKSWKNGKGKLANIYIIARK